MCKVLQMLKQEIESKTLEVFGYKIQPNGEGFKTGVARKLEKDKNNDVEHAFT